MSVGSLENSSNPQPVSGFGSLSVCSRFCSECHLCLHGQCIKTTTYKLISRPSIMSRQVKLLFQMAEPFMKVRLFHNNLTNRLSEIQHSPGSYGDFQPLGKMLCHTQCPLGASTIIMGSKGLPRNEGQVSACGSVSYLVKIQKRGLR